MPDASVLVVDDSRFVRASLVRALVSRFRIQQAESGERAWELLLLDPSIGAVLSDLNMPGVDGFELLRRVRGSMLERVRTLPFAVLSGADDPAQRDRARELGADRFVVKGDGVESLRDWLASRLVPDTGASGPAMPAPPPASPAAPPATQAPPAATQVPPAAPPAPEPAATLPTRSSAAPDGILAAAPPAAPPPAAPPPAAPPPAALQPAPPPPAADLSPRRVDATPPDEAGSIPAVVAQAPVAAPAARARGPGTSTSAAPHSPCAAPDALSRWLDAAIARPAAVTAPAADAPPVLLRLHAPGLDALPARLRRGVRSADALHVEGADTAWLCVPASEALALRLALRFGLLAAGRQALDPGPAAAYVAVGLTGIDPERAAEALEALRALPAEVPVEPGLSVRALAWPGAGGEGWRCALPWPAVRLLVA